MLVYALFALYFVTFRGVFMRFTKLTYWRDATVSVPYFLLFLWFGKATQEIFSKLDETKPEPPIFPGHKTKTEGEPKGGQGSATPRAGAPLLGHTRGCCGPPGRPLTPPLHLYKAFRIWNPKSIGVFQESVMQLRRHHRWILGGRSLCSGTLPGQGSALGAISIGAIASTAVSIGATAISINVAVSHNEEGVVLPRGWGLYR
jgi:hypothetical protein